MVMDEGGLALLELSHKHQLEIQEEIRNKISSILIKIEKPAWFNNYQEVRRELDKQLDTQYQCTVAEALENHLTAIRRDHELKSQIEERIIRNAAYKETKRKEKVLEEEKLRQERASAEAEAKCRAEEAKTAALAAERRASEVAKMAAIEAERRANEVAKMAALEAANKDFSTDERRIARLIKQIGGTEENVTRKSSENTNIFRNSSCQQPCIATFVKKVVARYDVPDAAFASAYVIVCVMSQIPTARDLLLAEFHKVCIYTVPKHMRYSKSVFASKEAYYKAIGYKEDNGKIESTADYLERLKFYMKLYGALVQTEIQGISNPHGPKEGWAWLARFLNTLPANMYTAVALNAFLQAAGFVLFRKFRSQFKKILSIISHDFLKALREQDDPDLNPIIAEIQTYVDESAFLEEPKGRILQGSLLSKVIQPDIEPKN